MSEVNFNPEEFAKLCNGGAGFAEQFIAMLCKDKPHVAAMFGDTDEEDEDIPEDAQKDIKNPTIGNLGIQETLVDIVMDACESLINPEATVASEDECEEAVEEFRKEVSIVIEKFYKAIEKK